MTYGRVVRARLGLERALARARALLAEARELRAVRAVAVLDRLRRRGREHERALGRELAVAGERVRVVAEARPGRRGQRGPDRAGFVVEGGGGEETAGLWVARVQRCHIEGEMSLSVERDIPCGGEAW